MKYTKDNNLLLRTIHFMNEANQANAFSGLPTVIPGFTGYHVKEKKRCAKQGIPIPTKFHEKVPGSLTPSVGMRHPEKRRGRRKAKALVQQLEAQKEA